MRADAAAPMSYLVHRMAEEPPRARAHAHACEERRGSIGSAHRHGLASEALSGTIGEPQFPQLQAETVP